MKVDFCRLIDYRIFKQYQPSRNKEKPFNKDKLFNISLKHCCDMAAVLKYSEDAALGLILYKK